MGKGPLGRMTLPSLILAVLIVAYAIFVAWYDARSATAALPQEDFRTRPSDEAILAAATLLRVSLPADDVTIKAAERAMYPRCPGDTFDDGVLRIKRLDDVMQAGELLLVVNEYDRNPPMPASQMIGYWLYRAGPLGRLWGLILPPPALKLLQKQVLAES